MFQHLFHMARKDGGFTFYGEPHRLAALYYLDFGFVLLLLASTAAACILLLLLPTMRRRLPTLALGFSALWTGAAIGYCLLIPEWQIGKLRLPRGTRLSYYPQRNAAMSRYSLGLSLGLSAVNITLYGYDVVDIYYDEMVDLQDTMSDLEHQFRAAQIRGLPIPILSIFEQVTSGQSFFWAFQIRYAGYYCTWMLKFALVIWTYALIVHCFVPAKSATYYSLSSLLILFTPVVYSALLRGCKSNLDVDGIPLVLRYGACYYTCIFTGMFSTTVGCALMAVSRWKPLKVETAFTVRDHFFSQLPLAGVPYDSMNMEDEGMIQMKSMHYTK